MIAVSSRVSSGLAACIVAVGTARCGSGGLPTTTLTLGETPLTVEIADDEAERARGLMHRDAMPSDRGMVFVYPDQALRRFWMKDTRIPLSIAFVDDDGTIKKIADMQPLSTARTSSVYPVRYAIEVNQGWFAAHGVVEGMRVTGLPDGTAEK